MMKKDVNGVIVEMTEEEIKKMEEEAAEIGEMPPTDAERLETLEGAILELAGVLFNG